MDEYLQCRGPEAPHSHPGLLRLALSRANQLSDGTPVLLQNLAPLSSYTAYTDMKEEAFSPRSISK